MSFKRRQSKRDSNHAHITECFESHGFSVLDMSMVGNGAPDIAVARNGHTLFVEIKRDERAPSIRERRPNQTTFAQWWKGLTVVARNAADVTKINETLFNPKMKPTTGEK